MVNRKQRGVITGAAVAAALVAGKVAAGGWGDLDLDRHGYFGLQAAAAEYELRPGGDWQGDADPAVVLLRAGAHANRFLSIEARLGTGVDEGEGDQVDVEIGHFYGIYGRGHLPIVGDWVSLYIALGQTRGEVVFRFDDAPSESVRESGYSMGLGVDIYVTRRLGLNLEYMEYFDERDDERDHRLNAVGFGITGVF